MGYIIAIIILGIIITIIVEVAKAIWEHIGLIASGLLAIFVIFGLIGIIRAMLPSDAGFLEIVGAFIIFVITIGAGTFVVKFIMLSIRNKNERLARAEEDKVRSIQEKNNRIAKAEEIKVKTEKNKQEKANLDSLMSYLQQNCLSLGQVEESDFKTILGKSFGELEYPGGENYLTIAMRFATGCEQTYFIKRQGWEEPYIRQIAREGMVSVNQLLKQPDQNRMQSTHLTPDAELLQRALDVHTKAKSVDIPAILVKEEVNGNILYSPTPFGKNRYGMECGEDNESVEEVISIDDLK